MTMFSIGKLTCIAAVAITCFATSATAQDRRPQILEGTQTIYERILTRPGAGLHNAPEGARTGSYPAFQPLYVFGRQNGWVEVGPRISGAPEGWVRDEATVLWKQNIVGAFTNPSGRNQQLFFDKREDLEWLLNHEALSDVQERLVAEANAGTINGARGVNSVEPSEFINIRDKLYLMPILDYTEALHPLSYDEILMMQVASIPKEAKPIPQLKTEAENPFDVGIVFVLDTTQSMETHIALTRRVVQNTVRQIQGTDVGNLVNFGVIGFRDNVEAAPGLEYRTKILSQLRRRQDQTEVIDAIGAAVNVAGVNSPGFNEDSVAGVEDAIDVIDWDQVQTGDHPIDARYVILVTDAGPKDIRDPNARSKIGTTELRVDAQGRNIVLMTLHLKTPTGKGNHEYAAQKYREMSRFEGAEFYFPIEGGSESAFEAVATRVVTALTDHVRLALGRETVLEEDEAGELADLGPAMLLRWLGSNNDTDAPDVLTGWISNLAAEAPQRVAVEPRLLVTRNEMATMADLLDRLVQYGEASQSSEQARDFFNQVQGLIADMAQNPDLVVNPEGETLGQALEFLDRLPYQSQVLGMTEERWAQSAINRRSIIDRMRQKHTQYKKWLFDSSVWTALYDGAPEGEHVFAMPFDVLP